jgi:hypothetical protein
LSSQFDSLMNSYIYLVIKVYIVYTNIKTCSKENLMKVEKICTVDFKERYMLCDPFSINWTL